MAIQLTKSEYEAILKARRERAKQKARQFVEPKAAFAGGFTVGLVAGLWSGLTGYGDTEPEYQIVEEEALEDQPQQLPLI